MQAIVFKVSHVSVVFSKSEFLGQALLHLCSLIVPRATVPVLNILLGLAIPLWAWEKSSRHKTSSSEARGVASSADPGARWPHLTDGRDSESRGGAPGPFPCLLSTPSPCPDLVFWSVRGVCPRWDLWHSRECSQEDLEPRGDVWWDLEGSAGVTLMDTELPAPILFSNRYLCNTVG